MGYDTVYPDISGVVYTTPQAAIESNQAQESSMSRGASGGCPQDSNNVPPPQTPSK